MRAPSTPEIALDASIGVVDFGNPPLPTVKELLAAADASMYGEKRAGGGAPDTGGGQERL